MLVHVTRALNGSDPIIKTQLGPFNATDSHIDPAVLQQIPRLFGPTSLATITLTILNGFASLLLIVLILVDNPNLKQWWKIVPSNRIPLSLAISIFVSHGIFIGKEFVGLNSFESVESTSENRLLCEIFNNLGFWGTWLW
jgi:hypothetical protein